VVEVVDAADPAWTADPTWTVGAVVVWVALLAMHPVSAAAPATLNRPVA
jgi:hypothetical protein